MSSSSSNLHVRYCVGHSETGCRYSKLHMTWSESSRNFRPITCFNLSIVMSLSTRRQTTSSHVKVTPSSVFIIAPFAYIVMISFLLFIVTPTMECVPFPSQSVHLHEKSLWDIVLIIITIKLTYGKPIRVHVICYCIFIIQIC